MSDTQTKWNAKHQNLPELHERTVLPILTDFQHLLPHKGRALDVACGAGHNAVFLAQHGLEVDAWDISTVAIDRLQAYVEQQQNLVVSPRVVDIQPDTFPQARTYDLILVSHYLDRELTSALVGALKVGGLLIYQTFCADVTPHYQGPRNPDYRLRRNELLQMFGTSLTVVYYREEGVIGDDLSQGTRNEAMLIAQAKEDTCESV